MSEGRVPKPASRDYVKFITADRLPAGRQSQLAANSARHATNVTWGAHAVLLNAFLWSLAFGLDEFIINQLRLPASWRWIIIVGIVFIYIGLSVLIKKREQRLIRRYLAKRLIADWVRPLFCVNCDYNLTGSTATACPECGAAIAAAHPSRVIQKTDEDVDAP